MVFVKGTGVVAVMRPLPCDGDDSTLTLKSSFLGMIGPPKLNEYVSRFITGLPRRANALRASSAELRKPIMTLPRHCPLPGRVRISIRPSAPPLEYSGEKRF